MKTKWKHTAARAALAVLAIAFLLPPGKVGADLPGLPALLATSVGEKEGAGAGIQSELLQIREKMEREREAISRILDKQGGVLDKLKALRSQLARSEGRLEKLRTERKVLETESRELKSRIRDLEAGLERQREFAAARVRARYLFESRGEARLWLEAESLSELSRRRKYLSSLFRSDMKTIDEYKALISDWKDARARLGEKAASLAALERVQAEQTRQLNGDKKALETILRSVNSERSAHEEVLAELEASASRLQELIGRLDKAEDGGETSGFSDYQGTLCYPAPGKVVSGFGRKVHPRFNTVTMQKGIEIGSPRGTPVRSVWGGVVRFAEWFRGYGNLVILDHGGGYYTVYAHLDSVGVSVGQKLEKGEVIGAVGDTGSLSDPSLYFEIRRHGQPLDPALWLTDCVQE